MTEKKIITLKKPDDGHCHLRNGPMLAAVVRFTESQFARAVIMPNTTPPILTAADANNYRRKIFDCCKTKFGPVMTIQITDKTTPRMIAEAKSAGVIAGKVYPQGVTTNSKNGVTNFDAIYPALTEMQGLEMLLLLHGEAPGPGIFCLDRELLFLGTLFRLTEDFPELKIVLEHITTKDAIDAIMLLPNVAATITVHHLLLTLDDVVGGLISPHHFCKPIAKRPRDREALLEAAMSGNCKFFYGGDSAPHDKIRKECDHGCAGVFNAPVALPLLVELFEKHGRPNLLSNFVSGFFADFYGLERNQETIQLTKNDWTVPKSYSYTGVLGDPQEIVPFMAGETLHWQVA